MNMNQKQNSQRTLSWLAIAILLTFGALAPVAAEEISVTGSVKATTTLKTRPLVKPVPKVGQDIRAIQQEKRGDIMDIRVLANDKIMEERAQMKEAQMKAKIDGMTVDERATMKDTRIETRTDIKNIRTEQFAEVKLRRDEARMDIKAAISERKMKMASSTDARKEERKQKGVEKAAELADKMVKRISAAIERLEKLSVRIQSRIDKVKLAGGVTLEAEAAIAEAKVNITAAKEGLTNLSATFAAAATLENPKDGIAKIREAVEIVNAKIKAAAEALRKAAKSLEGQKGIDVAASIVISTSLETDTDPTAAAGAATE